MYTEKPKLREVEAHAIEHEGKPLVLLRDPMQLSDSSIAVPRPMAPLLPLMDGTRDGPALEIGLALRTGVRLAPGLLAKLIEDLDQALLLDNERYADAMRSAREAYRSAEKRSPTLHSDAFPWDPREAALLMQSYVDALPAEQTVPGGDTVRGLVSPHIDYQRGGAVYAQVWQAAACAVQNAELVVILGTDHRGSAGAVTLTGQSYATPWGILPTDRQLVRELGAELGEDYAYGEELNHRTEHSIELALVWLHFARKGNPVDTVPILCGHFGEFIAGKGSPGKHEPYCRMLEVLGAAAAKRRAVVVAAADLAHVGPVFGDSAGLDSSAKLQQRRADQRLIEAMCAGDAEQFYAEVRVEGDRRRICGLPPIYLALRLLEGSVGSPAGYDICPADPYGTSVVTVAGVLLT